ncbi:MAG: tail fiber protein [Anaerocolumna sp.]
MDDFLGSIALFAFNFAPQGYVLCDGRTLSIAENNALYSLIGDYYGGDGVNNFQIPNMLGLEPVPNMKYYIFLWGYYPGRQ